jgi:two-component system, sensor histidine kinase and response regulator
MSEPINVQKYNELKELMEDDFNEIISQYISSAHSMLETLKKAIAQKDFAEITSSAHALKSPSAQIGAEKLAEIYAKLEHLGRGGNNEGLDILFHDTKTEQALVISELSKLSYTKSHK